MDRRECSFQQLNERLEVTDGAFGVVHMRRWMLEFRSRFCESGNGGRKRRQNLLAFWLLKSANGILREWDGETRAKIEREHSSFLYGKWHNTMSLQPVCSLL